MMTDRELRYVVMGCLYCLTMLVTAAAAYLGHAWLAGFLGFMAGVLGMRAVSLEERC